MVKEVDAQFGGFDVLINNACDHPASLRTGRTPEAEVDRLLTINIKASTVAAHAMPVLRRAGGGSVINIASVTAMRPRTQALTWSTPRQR